MTESNVKEPAYTIEEYFRCLPGGLADEVASMAHFVGAGRNDFHLSGKTLDAFIAESVKAVMQAGGWPVVSVEEGDFWWWTVTDRWGGTPKEIAENLLAEWHRRGAPDLTWGEYPFMPPELLGLSFRR